MPAKQPRSRTTVSPASRKLRNNELRWTCPKSWIPKSRKSGGDPLSNFIGQERALEALEMGLSVDAPGYNIFVAGLESGQKFATLAPLLERVRMNCQGMRDHVYVHNFDDPVRPQHLSLPSGSGNQLAQAMRDWIAALRREIPRALNSSEHQSRREKLIRRYANAEEQLFRRLSRRAGTAGLSLIQVEDESGTHPDFFFPVDDSAIPLNEVAKLADGKRPSEAKLRRLKMAREGLLEQLQKASHKSRLLGLRLNREVQNLDELRVQNLVQGLTIATSEEVDCDEELAAWLGSCAGFALRNLQLFYRPEDQQADDDDSEQIGLEVFEVNVVRSAPSDDCPTIFEIHPNYSNLFGAVERRRLGSGPGFFHLAIRPGSLLAADGGVLVLHARDILKEAEVWRALKRTLQNHVLEIHTLEGLSPLGVTGVRPEPAPIDLKVVLVGESELYETLQESDYDFDDIFKVKAEFDEEKSLEQRNVTQLCHALRERAKDEELLPFSVSGLQALVERAVRDAGRRSRISARVNDLFDYAREANYWARKSRKRRIDRSAVDRARQQFRHQHDLEPEWHKRSVLEGVQRIDTDGAVVASINALTVVSIGPLSSGRVARISASVATGDDSCLNIEREVDLSGPIHNKGMLILESFMRNRFGQKRALPIKAAIAFDQSYGPIDGDSASSTETYALLSAIGGFPLRQDLAVTGAVSMDGDILAIGGANEKIAGFFELCNARGLTGSQGVLIPASNVDDLMLEDDLLDACKAGKFHLYAIDNIDQGISLLSGLAAGRRRKDGNFPPDTVMGLVEAGLAQFAADDKESTTDKKNQKE